MENNEVIRWSSDIPKHGDPYWYIDGCYDVAKKTHWKNSKMDRVRYRANMLFFTEEQANAYCELFWHSRNPSRIGTDGKVWEYTIGK